MKRWISVILVIVLAVNLAGCESLRKKFTRKNKGAAKAPRFYQLQKYKKKPAADLYKQHFAYWESWQSELISVIGQNRKKDMRCIAEATGQLKDLQNLLAPEKAAEMQKHVDNMEGAKNAIFSGELTFANRDNVKRTVEREDRAVRRDFCFAKVKDFLRVEEEEEPIPQLGAVGKEVNIARQ